MSYQSIFFIVAIIAVFYLLLIRPQQKRRRQEQQMQDSIRPGIEVLTRAGMYAKVVSVDTEGASLLLEVAPGVTCKYMKQAIMRVVPESQVDGPAAAAALESGENTEQEPEAVEPVAATVDAGTEKSDSADDSPTEDKAGEDGTEPETSTDSESKVKRGPFSGSSLFGSSKDDRRKSS